MFKECYYDVKSIAFCCVAIGIHGFDQKKAAEISLTTVNSIILCTYKNADYAVYKDLMSAVYFPISKIH